jgi:hypothetical protein
MDLEKNSALFEKVEKVDKITTQVTTQLTSDKQKLELTLELSLKPFKDPKTDEAVIAELIRQYADLIHTATSVTFQLWSSDGSEILNYSGNLDDEFEWARYIGNANPTGPVPNDPLGLDPHSKTYSYITDNIPPRIWTYAALSILIKQLKTGIKDKDIKVGCTFDPGPEFAISDWKYKRHPESCEGSKALGKDRFVTCGSILHADTYKYAGFPFGLTEGTPFGTFFGKQVLHFCKDLGFDYLWLSNGFGCGTETWTTIGSGFDGKVFIPNEAAKSSKRALSFWKYFRKEVSSKQLSIRLRGTNLTTGIDLSTDGSPWRTLYTHNSDENSFGISSPPNSPWAALDGNFGLELAGWMSHTAELSDNDSFLFRFYANDPWWKNSPWLDRYGEDAHDIYLPLSICRIDKYGKIQTPNRINILTVDDSFGNFPKRVARGLIPPLLNALDHSPDDLPMTIWVYPFDEYHDFIETKSRTEEAFSGDWLITASINEGFPLNAVISTTNYLSTLSLYPNRFNNSILVTRVPDQDTHLSLALQGHIQNGGKVLFYGPLLHAGNEMLTMIGVDLTTPLVGDFNLHCDSSFILDKGGMSQPTILKHRSEINAGGLEAISRIENLPGFKIIASAVLINTDHNTEIENNSLSRLCTVSRFDPLWQGGGLSWVRGTYCASYVGGHLLTPDDPSIIFRGERLMRIALAELGYEICIHRHSPPSLLQQVTKDDDSTSTSSNDNTVASLDSVPWELIQLEAAKKQDSPVIGIHTHNGGLWVSLYARDTTSKISLSFPEGAPLLIGTEALVSHNKAEYALSRAMSKECRALIKQEAESIISTIEGTAEQMGITRRFWLRGLRDATITLLLPKDSTPSLLVNPLWPFISGIVPNTYKDNQGRLVCDRITGALCISW